MRHILRNWKTSLGGVICLITALIAIHNHPDKATDPEVAGLIATGLGMLWAKDGDKTGVVEPPAQPKP